ncbi:MAG TPA: glucosaminidase domain-containing protein [Solirubrobacteraceae bacterium]
MVRSFSAPLALVCMLFVAPAAQAQSGTGVIRGTGKVSARATPGGKVVTKLRGGRQITISCQMNGPTANGSGGRSAIWDRTRINGRTLYVADAVVDTGGGLVAGWCDAPGPVSPVTPATSGACSLKSQVPLVAPFTDHDKFIAATVPGAQRSDRDTGVPAAVTIAQAILESGWGQFNAGANNYFGIKAKPTSKPGVFEWSNTAIGCVLKKTLEEVGGRMQTEIGAFRAYRTLTASIRDHGARLLANPVYAPAFKYTEDDTKFVRKIARYYATDSKYASKVLTIMRRHKLRRYDVKGTAPAAPATDAPATGGGGAQAP